MTARRSTLINVRGPVDPTVWTSIELMLWATQGVEEVRASSSDSSMHVLYRPERLSLAELVRMIEDAGPTVISVAERLAEEHVTV